MDDDLGASRRKLRDIADAARRGIHRPELVVAARQEIERLVNMMSEAPPSDSAAIRSLVERYEVLIAELLD